MSSVLNRRILRRQMWQVRKHNQIEQKKAFSKKFEITGDDDYDLGACGNPYWQKIIYCMKH